MTRGLAILPLAHHLSVMHISVDAIIGNPPGALGLIPEQKIDDSLHKLLDYEFEVLLLCDGPPVLSDAKQKVRAFLSKLDSAGAFPAFLGDSGRLK